MEIGGQPVQAELLSADKARGIYETFAQIEGPRPARIRRARCLQGARLPHRAEQPQAHHPFLFPGAPSEAGLISYVYPLNTEKFSAKPIKNVSIKVELATRRSLKTIYSPSHAVEIKRDGANKAVIGYEAADVQPNTDFALYFAPEQEEVGLNLLTYKRAAKTVIFCSWLRREWT